jgi:hypothetical protein
MKFIFKKIGSVLASTAMITSTVALAAAASFPSPFVKDGKANVGIVYGAASANTDYAAATEISSFLNTKLTTQSAGGAAAGATPGGEDFVKLEKGSNYFNLGEDTNDFYPTIDEDELSVLLAKGEYLTDDNEDYEYEQEVRIGDLDLTHFQDTDFNNDEPIIGFDIASGTFILNYTIDFTPDNVECDDSTASGDDFLSCETTNLPLMGKSYFVSDIDTTSNGWRIKLLDSAAEGTVREGETTTVVVDGTSFDVTATWMDADEVRFQVSSGGTVETTNKLMAGQTQKVAGGTAHLGVKDVSRLEVAGETGVAEFSIGKGELTIENGVEVELNSDPVSDITEGAHEVVAYITNSSATDLDKITFTWNVEDDAWIAPGVDLVYPVFETFTLSMNEFVFPKSEVAKVSTRGDDSVRVDAVVKEGDVSFDVLYTDNSTSFGEWDGLGEKSDHKLVTSDTTGTTSTAVSVTLNESEDSYFVATWISGDDAESYVFEIQSITPESGKNKTILDNKASDGSDVTFDQVGDSESVGEITMNLISALDSTGVAVINFTAASSGNVYANRLVTKEGLQFRLPVSSGTSTGDGYINLTASPSTWVMNFTEEDDDGNIASGTSFTATLGFDSDDGAEVTAVSVTGYETEDGSDKYRGYVTSALATETLYNNPSSGLGDLEVTYHGAESYAEVFLADTSTGDGSTGGSSGGVMIVSDSELASVSSKNLIVVGGSCVNTVAANLLGVAFPTCGADFTAKAGIGAGEYLIETFSRSGGTVATLVAGYNAGDTTTGAKALVTMPDKVETLVGKKYTGTSESTLNAVIN